MRKKLKEQNREILDRMKKHGQKKGWLKKKHNSKIENKLTQPQ